MTEQEQLLAEIAAAPDDDTVRLAFADYLDGLDTVRVVCGECAARIFAFGGKVRPDCVVCEGTGTALDTSNRDRAELIRLQCELARRWETGDGVEWERVSDTLRVRTAALRTAALRTAHPEWSRVKCPGICKSGVLSFAPCQLCNGTRNALHQRKIHWSRGFIEAVEARSGEVWSEQQWSHYEPPTSVFMPTSWARSIVKAIPTLREIRLTDVDDCLEERRSVFWWRDDGVYDHDPRLPKSITPLDEYPTRKAATTALAESVYRWVRDS